MQQGEASASPFFVAATLSVRCPAQQGLSPLFAPFPSAFYREESREHEAALTKSKRRMYG